LTRQEKTVYVKRQRIVTSSRNSKGETNTDHLEKELEEVGVNHVALNLRFNQRPVEETLYLLADELLPSFPSHHTNVGNQELANQELANQECA